MPRTIKKGIPSPITRGVIIIPRKNNPTQIHPLVKQDLRLTHLISTAFAINSPETPKTSMKGILKISKITPRKAKNLRPQILHQCNFS